MAAKTINLIVISLLVNVIHLDAQDNIRCDMSDRYGSCDAGFCCVRDQFLASYVYCKRIPTNTHHCMTVVSESECACASNLTCVPNINLPTFTSVYGKCQGNSSTDIPETTTTAAFHKPMKPHV